MAIDAIAVKVACLFGTICESLLSVALLPSVDELAYLLLIIGLCLHRRGTPSAVFLVVYPVAFVACPITGNRDSVADSLILHLVSFESVSVRPAHLAFAGALALLPASLLHFAICPFHGTLPLHPVLVHVSLLGSFRLNPEIVAFALLLTIVELSALVVSVGIAFYAFTFLQILHLFSFLAGAIRIDHPPWAVLQNFAVDTPSCLHVSVCLD